MMNRYSIEAWWADGYTDLRIEDADDIIGAFLQAIAYWESEGLALPVKIRCITY